MAADAKNVVMSATSTVQSLALHASGNAPFPAPAQPVTEQEKLLLTKKKTAQYVPAREVSSVRPAREQEQPITQQNSVMITALRKTARYTTTGSSRAKMNSTKSTRTKLPSAILFTVKIRATTGQAQKEQMRIPGDTISMITT